MKLEHWNDTCLNSTIGIWGTGAYGAMALQVLELEYGLKPSFFIDINKRNHRRDYLGIPVISPDDISVFGVDIVLLFSLNIDGIIQEFGAQLMTCRIISPMVLLEMVDHSKVDNKFTLNRLKTLADQLIAASKTYEVRNSERNAARVNSIDIVVTQRCTLKCEDCSNLMQYYSRPKQIESSKIIESLEALKGKLDYVHEFRIIGGEPLLNKQFGEIVKNISENFDYGYIVIYTNGTLVPKREEIASLANIKRLSFKISDYGESLSRKCKELEALLDEYGILTIRERIEEWQDSGTIVMHDRGDKDLSKVFGQCCVNDCFTLMGEHLFICPFSANLFEIDSNIYGFIERFDVGNLLHLSEEVGRRVLMDFLGSHKFLTACNFCNGRDHNVPKVKAAVQRQTVKQI